MSARWIGLLVGAVGTAAPSAASAHLIGVAFGDFYAGALHLVLAPEHVAALVALAVFAASNPRRDARWTLLGLPIGLVIGVSAAPMAGPLAGTSATAPSSGPLGLELWIAVSLIAPGALGAAAVRAPALALALIAAALGVVHGFANGVSGVGAGVDWPLYASGVIVGGSVVGTLLIAVAAALGSVASWAPLAQRVLSSWAAAIGAVYLVFTLAT